MTSLKRRLERLEATLQQGIPVFLVNYGETPEEVWERYLANHPQYKDVDTRMIFQTHFLRLIKAEAPPSIPKKERAGP